MQFRLWRIRQCMGRLQHRLCHVRRIQNQRSSNPCLSLAGAPGGAVAPFQ